MVEIRFRIIPCGIEWSKMNLEQLNYEGSVQGFFSINVNGNTYGYYHNNLLREGEEGFDLITTWFEHLTQSFLILNDSKYVAVSDIDSYNTWIEFVETSDQNLCISIVVQEDKTGKGAIVTKPFDNYEYGDWKQVIVDKNEFRTELIKQTYNFLDSLKNINSYFPETKRIKSIVSNLEII